MVFQPGKSGNPSGRPKDRPWKDAIRKALRRAEDIGDRRQLDQLAWTILGKAADGDISALQEVANRLDGRVPQPVVGDDDSDPVSVRTIITGVARDGD